MRVELQLSDDGSVTFVGPDGEALPPRLVRAVRDQMGSDLDEWLAENCDRWNKGLSRMLAIHQRTTAPGARVPFEDEGFLDARPEPPEARPIDLIARFWRPRRERIEAENASAQRSYETLLASWSAAKRVHEAQVDARIRKEEAAMNGAVDAMADVLEERVAMLELPWNSGVSFEVEDSRTGWIDLDLPEIEDLPTQVASVAGRGVAIRVKDRSETQIRKEYAQLIHAITFHVAGEVFAALPTLAELVISSYSQRTNVATGHVSDEYLLSARIPRHDWEQIDFGQLAQIDVLAALERFALIRRMTKTGVFTPIQPHARI